MMTRELISLLWNSGSSLRVLWRKSDRAFIEINLSAAER